MAALSDKYVPSEYFEDILLITPAVFLNYIESPLGVILKNFNIL